MKYEKIYLITRSDLKPGQQAVQAAHALTEFIFEHQQQAKYWKTYSNTIVMLVVDSEEKLEKIIFKCSQRGIRYSSFYEPDLDHMLTAIAIEPGELSSKVCSGIPLALR